MSERRRWDTDQRFTGVADATAAVRPLERLVDACRTPGWVTEDAAAHLGVQLRRACDSPASPWRWLGDEQQADGVYVVDLARSAVRDVEIYREVVALLAVIAESAFAIHRVDGRTVDCVTGMLPGDGDFATHGHTVRVRLHPEAGRG